MTGSCLSFLCAGILAVCGAVGPAAGQNSGQLFGLKTENDALAWRAIGRLDTHGVGFCTATLITPDYVLTAAHCVYSPQTGEPIKPGDSVFRAGFRFGQTVAERGIAQIEVHADYNHADGSTAKNIRHDVALLRLAQPIPTSELNPFVVSQKVMEQGAVSLVSYGRDRETLPSRQDVCEIRGTYEAVMMFDCEATFGSSGAPVLRKVNGTDEIVSIISGGGTIDGERLSFGMVLPDLVEELQHQMWVNRPKPVATINRIKIRSGSTTPSVGGAKFVRP